MPHDPGSILLASYPFTDQSSAKQRPVLVVSEPRFNRGDDFIVVPLSSRVVPNDPFGIHVLSTEPYFRQTGLRTDSTIKWSKPFVISSKVIVRQLGKLPDDLFRNAQRCIRSMFERVD